jgi:hypothetical protein
MTSYEDSCTRVRDSLLSSGSALKRVLRVFKSPSKDQGSLSWSSSIRYHLFRFLSSLPLFLYFLPLSPLFSHHRLSGGAVTPFSL